MHIFFTGAKRVGKSTLVDQVLDSFPGRVGGFRTKKITDAETGEYMVHLIPVNGDQKPTRENFLFVCRREDPELVRRFDRLGREALAPQGSAELLVMDELGPHEAQAQGFQAVVWEVLDGEIPVLGVLQEASADFLNRIKTHPRVKVIRVTEENRDALGKEIPELIEILTEGG